MPKIKAPRNKTIELTDTEIKKFATCAVKLNHRTPIEELYNKIIHQDTFKVLDFLPRDSIDLMIVDPPYNLTKNFGDSTFKEMDLSDYKKWFDKQFLYLKKMLRFISVPTGKPLLSFLKLPENICCCKIVFRGNAKKVAVL